MRHPSLSFTYSFSEQFLGGLVKLRTKIEWMSDSSKKSMPWIYLKNKNLPSTVKQDLVIIFIDLFWKSIGEHEGVSHPGIQGMKGKLWNNSYAYLRLWTPDPAWSSRIFIDPFCSGRAKSRCGGVLAVDFDDFYRQHSFGFHAFRTKLLFFTNINKFHEFWWVFEFRSNIYEIKPKWEESQAGRPTTMRFDLAAVWFMILSPRTSQLKGGSGKIH